MTTLLNVARAQRIFGNAGVDAVIATTHANVMYLSGFRGFGQRLMPTTQVYAVARLDDLASSTVILPAGELDIAAQFPPPNATFSPYGRFFVEHTAGNGHPREEMARYGSLASADTVASALNALTDQLDRLRPATRIALDERGISPLMRDAVRLRYGDRLVDGAAL